jgi:hypothetical protein
MRFRNEEASIFSPFYQLIHRVEETDQTLNFWRLRLASRYNKPFEMRTQNSGASLRTMLFAKEGGFADTETRVGVYQIVVVFFPHPDSNLHDVICNYAL